MRGKIRDMSKVASARIARGPDEGHVVVARALELYILAGNPIELWGLEDYLVRAHFLIAAARAGDETPGYGLGAALQ
ncbi:MULTISPECIES: hypothetical protein [Hyphomicrobiales]|jgi:hypothetical protein|uniref:hypothetical protein n=1 Tax=Hyphomicrobiales TaxID=356 RepID=UPI000367F385|nr:MULTISPECIES: hypothetical protein [Phyllobacteriaceae]MCX8572898.1 hypothetical protein [Aminobacter sp. MET-1]